MKLNKKYRCWYVLVFLGGTLSLVSACATLPHSVTYLNDGFEAISNPIEVKKPNWVFRDKFYNVTLGDYAVTNTNIENFKQTSERRSISKREERTGFIDNLVYDGRLASEKVKYETVAYTSKGRFSFDIPFDSNNVFQAICKQSKIVHREQERSRTTFGQSEKRSNDGIRSEQLQQSTLLCNLQAETGTWTLDVSATRDMKPVVSLNSDDASYQLVPIFVTRTPGTFHVAIVHDEPETKTQAAPGYLYGYAILNETDKVASIFIPNSDDNTIRIKNGLNESEARFLLGVSHALILNSWLDN